MRVLNLLIVALVADIPVGMGQEKQPPPNEPPQLWRASASEQDGKVVIQIARPEYVSPRRAVAAEAMEWRNLQKVTPGPSAHAFGVDGKRVEPKDVLKALAEPKGVVVFVRFLQPLLDPDPFYLALLRPGTMVLVVAAAAVADPRP